MPPEVIPILIGAGIGLAVGNVALATVQSEWWHHMAAVWQWRRVTRPARLREVRRTTRAALAYTRSRRARRPVSPPVVLIPEQRGRHRAGDRAGSGRPAPAMGEAHG